MSANRNPTSRLPALARSLEWLDKIADSLPGTSASVVAVRMACLCAGLLPILVKTQSNALRRWTACLTAIVLIVGMNGCAAVPKTVEDPRIGCENKACKPTCRIFKKAEAGSARHQATVGALYTTGFPSCVPRDFEAALVWNQKAAAQGYDEAMFRLGQAHQYGWGTTVNELEAMEWYRRAAEAGYDDALLRRIDNSVYRHEPPGAKESFNMLAAKNAARLSEGREQHIDRLGTIAVTGGWQHGKPELGQPRGGVSGVTGKLGTSAVVGGGLVWAGGGPIGAAMYGILVAVAGVKKGIEDGKAGKAIHEELNSIFEGMDLTTMVRSKLQERLDDIEALSSPVLVVADEDSPETDPADTRVELVFENAKLDNIAHAWQFEPGNRPGLILVISTRVRVIPHGGKKPLFEELVEYKGQQLLNGLEAPFRDEVQRAASYIAGQILLRLVKFENAPGIREKSPEVTQ